MVCIFLLINISFTVLDEFLMECCLVQKAGNMHLEMCLGELRERKSKCC